METRENFRTVPSRPIALALALLAVLALALTTWFVFGVSNQTRGIANDRTLVTNVHPQVCRDTYSPHDPVCGPKTDPYSPHDQSSHAAQTWPPPKNGGHARARSRTSPCP